VQLYFDRRIKQLTFLEPKGDALKYIVLTKIETNKNNLNKLFKYQTINMLVAMSICLYSFGQKEKQVTSSKKTMINFDSIVYHDAYLNNDYSTAIHAIYYMMAKDPTNLNYKDSLARLYFISGAYEKSAKISREINVKQPSNKRAMEFLALSEKATGNYKQSLEVFEKLHAQTADVEYAYSIAELQYELKRFGECTQTIESILSNPISEKINLTIYATPKIQQTVSYKAAILNIKGMMYKELNELNIAVDAFKQSLIIAPHFLLPSNNLKSIDKNNSNNK
jgi:tetratricopeptide (TPR) repeat protein